MKRVFLNFVLLSFLLGVAFASQLRNTKTSTPEMKKVILNFVLLSFFFLVLSSVNLANGADMNLIGKCKIDVECYHIPSCDIGQGYCDNNGVCKCPILQCHANPDCLGMLDLNHLGECDTDLECYTMPSCNRGNGYCDQKDGKCKCPK
ncbi:unnamed protein product [Brassica oleracea var. botrytis]